MTENAPFMSAAKPLYELGDLVAFACEVDGVMNYALAYITGFEYKPPHTYVDDWWYSVRIITPVEICDYDQIPQHEILGSVIHGTQKRFRPVCDEVGFIPLSAIHQSNGLGVG